MILIPFDKAQLLAKNTKHYGDINIFHLNFLGTRIARYVSNVDIT